MTITITQTLPEETWRCFVEEHPEGNIFHTPEMFQVFEQVKGHKPQLWAATGPDRQVLALLLPVQLTLMDGLLRQLTTRAVVYGSLLAAPGPAGREALAQLLEHYNQAVKGKLLFTELRNLSDLAGVQPLLQEKGYQYEDHLNYLIDLNRSSEEVLQSIGSRTRKRIRKGVRDNIVQISQATNASELTHWYEILQKTYQNAHVPLADRSLFEAAFNILYPKGMAKFFLAKVDGVSVACSVELPYKKTIYGWYGGTDREYGQYNPNEMLMWYVLEWGVNNGYHLYDFGGAGKPDEEYGVRDFKAKFGGELVSFGRNTYVHSPLLLSISKKGYEAYRRFL